MDYYIENPERLEGQPKRAIADYVEQNGILVPRRFDSLAEARRSHKAVLLRSEHLQEYNGVSGLLNSFQLSSMWPYISERETKKLTFSPRGLRSVEEVKQAYFNFEEDTGGCPPYRRYCRLLGLDEDAFVDEVSFSIWEALGGLNRTVVADSAIRGRYHVMTLCCSKDGQLCNYSIVEDGELSQEFIEPLPEDLRSDLANLTRLYETVRNLDRFDPNHCPIMEFQTYKGRNYFLQYHRARDFSPSDFTLERDPADREIEVPFVRGATTEEGMDCKVTLYYARETDWDFSPGIEDGSYDFHSSFVFSELRVRERKVQMNHAYSLQEEISKFVDRHKMISKLFKSQVSIIHNIQDILVDDTLEDLRQRTKSGQNSYIDLHIISDGRRCFIRRII
jgi:hypothetical protein